MYHPILSVLVIAVFSALAAGPAHSQELRLSARLAKSGTSFRAAGTLARNRNDCSIALFSSASRSSLNASITRGAHLASFPAGRRSRSFSAHSLSTLKRPRSGRTSIYFRARAVCSDRTFISRIVVLIPPQPGSTGIATPTEWILALRNRILAATVTVDEAFPSLSFDNPVYVTHAPDSTDRLFVVEQQGVIRSFLNQASSTSSSVFLDIRSRTLFDGEQGMLGLAFHPRFAQNGQAFVFYNRTETRNLTVSRFTLTAGSSSDLDPNSELVLLDIPKPFENHNGGMIEFGQDGFLYIGTGDGGSGGDPLNNAQNRASLLGKILRIDVDAPEAPLAYGIPQSNPFINNASGFRTEIFAYGLRNPFRFSFDRLRGSLWAGDVGQSAREEINIISRGKNYGWNITEGNLCYPNPTGCSRRGLTAPVLDYPHDQGRSVTGGYVFRGKSTPYLYSQYIFGDFVSGRIWAFPSEGRNRAKVELLDSGISIASFGEDRAGNLLIVSYSDGKLYKLE